MQVDVTKPIPPESYLVAIENIIRKSYAEAQDALDAQKITHKVSDYAHAVLANSLMISNAGEVFNGDENVKIEMHGHGAVVLFRNLPNGSKEFDIRFKKCNDKFQTFNARTARNSRFENQLSLFDSIPEVSQRFNLNAVYKRINAGTSIETWITFPVGSRSIAWKIQLTNGEIDQSIEKNAAINQTQIPDVARVIPTVKELPTQKQANDGSDKS
jgi:hypothetical protein